MKTMIIALILFAQDVSAETVFEKMESGTWGRGEPSPNNCPSNPESFSFSQDHTRMFISSPIAMTWYDGSVAFTAKYDVITHDDASITVSLDGETRLTEDGVPVAWIIRLLEDDLYCWGRADRSYFWCVAPAMRCPTIEATS